MKKQKVLVVEDDQVARRYLAKSVEKEGFSVSTAENGAEGFEIFQRESPAIVISDLRMPKMNGIDLMKKIMAQSPNTQFIVITAFAEKDAAITALSEGALDYIKKPIDLDLLAVALGRAMEKIGLKEDHATYPTILFLEDDDETRNRFCNVLEKEDYQVFRASNGAEAVEKFTNNKIDILITDINMPHKDGLEVLHELRGISKDFEAIVLTGYGDENNAIRAMREGAHSFIKKPVNLDQLLVVIEKGLEKLNLKRALSYRDRELQLSKELIFKITKEKKIVVGLSKLANSAAEEIAEGILDTIPLGMFIVDKDLTIEYSNQHLIGKLGYNPQKIDTQFVNSLKSKGIDSENLLNDLSRDIGNTFTQTDKPFIKTRLGEYAFISFTTVNFVSDQKSCELVLGVIRYPRA